MAYLHAAKQYLLYGKEFGKSQISHCVHSLELKQISEISGYPFQIHHLDTGFELFRIVDNYFKQL